jgi:hypothetical protein
VRSAIAVTWFKPRRLRSTCGSLKAVYGSAEPPVNSDLSAMGTSKPCPRSLPWDSPDWPFRACVGFDACTEWRNLLHIFHKTTAVIDCGEPFE